MSKTYNVGAIGTSWASRGPMQTIASYSRTKLVAVCSARKERAQETAAKFGAHLAFDDYRHLIESPEVDLVYIASPVYLHAEMLTAAIAAGKPVLCEKPLAKNVAEAEALVQSAAGGGVKPVVAFVMRNVPHSQAIKKLIAAGDLGDIRHIAINRFVSPPGGGADRPWTWLRDASSGGGMLGAFGCHYFDLVGWWAGEYATVAGQLRTWITSASTPAGEVKPVTSEDSFALQATMRSGAVFTMHFSSMAGPQSGNQIELYGSKATVVLTANEQLMMAGTGERELKPIPAPEPAWPAEVAAAQVPRFAAMLHEVIRAAEDPSYSPSPTLADGLRCQQVMDAIRHSSATGELVTIARR